MLFGKLAYDEKYGGGEEEGGRGGREGKLASYTSHVFGRGRGVCVCVCGGSFIYISLSRTGKTLHSVGLQRLANRSFLSFSLTQFTCYDYS